MANLSNKIKLYAEANGKVADMSSHDGNVVLQNEGSGDYIHTWNISGLAQPTEEQLNALESQATTLESNYQVIKTRINLYGTTAEQLEYIVENGVDAFVTKQNQIKLDNPKT